MRSLFLSLARGALAVWTYDAHAPLPSQASHRSRLCNLESQLDRFLHSHVHTI